MIAVFLAVRWMALVAALLAALLAHWSGPFVWNALAATVLGFAIGGSAVDLWGRTRDALRPD